MAGEVRARASAGHGEIPVASTGMTKEERGNDEKESAGMAAEGGAGAGAGHSEIPVASTGMTKKGAREWRGRCAQGLVQVTARYPWQARV